MDRDELMSQISRATGSHCSAEQMYCVLQTAFTYLQSSPRWIPVSERMPNEEEIERSHRRFLAVVKIGGTIIRAQVDLIDGQWWFYYKTSEENLVEMYGRIVTHWCEFLPIPKELSPCP